MLWLSKQLRKLGQYAREKSAVSTVEYALIVVAVIGIVGLGVTTLSGAFDDMFDDLEDELNKATSLTLSKAGAGN